MRKNFRMPSNTNLVTTAETILEQRVSALGCRTFIIPPFPCRIHLYFVTFATVVIDDRNMSQRKGMFTNRRRVKGCIHEVIETGYPPGTDRGQRYHQSLDYKTPNEIYYEGFALEKVA